MDFPKQKQIKRGKMKENNKKSHVHCRMQFENNLYVFLN